MREGKRSLFLLVRSVTEAAEGIEVEANFTNRIQTHQIVVADRRLWVAAPQALQPSAL
jgi:hypothetical protein